jgi:hypothetical protein
MSMQFVKLVGVLAVLAFASNSAVADTYTWNTTGNLNPGYGTACAGTVACKTTFTSTIGGKTLTAKAYSTSTIYPVGTNPTTVSGSSWIEAQIALYSGGIGIKNTKTYDANEAYEPEHAIDNDQIHDILVFELPDGVFDPNAFKLGYLNGDSDVQAWIGGSNLASNFDFRNICFTGCADSTKNLATLGGGFSEITGPAGNGFTDVPVNTSTDFNTTKTGKYLIMAGNLGQGTVSGYNDAFKISQLSSNTVKVPVPGSLLLLGLGLTLLTFVRSRPVARVSPRVA